MTSSSMTVVGVDGIHLDHLLHRVEVGADVLLGELNEAPFTIPSAPDAHGLGGKMK